MVSAQAAASDGQKFMPARSSSGSSRNIGSVGSTYQKVDCVSAATRVDVAGVVPEPENAEKGDERQRQDERAQRRLAAGELGGKRDDDAGERGLDGEIEHGGGLRCCGSPIYAGWHGGWKPGGLAGSGKRR